MYIKEKKNLPSHIQTPPLEMHFGERSPVKLMKTFFIEPQLSKTVFTSTKGT
jgi:hypothetical protein